MNDKTIDSAFEPVDAPAIVAPADGTVRIVEGDQFLDGKLVKAGEPVGYIQITETDEAPKH